MTDNLKLLRITVFILSIIIAFLMGTVMGTYRPIDLVRGGKVITIDKYYIQFSIPRTEGEFKNMILFNSAQKAVLDELKRIPVFNSIQTESKPEPLGGKKK